MVLQNGSDPGPQGWQNRAESRSSDSRLGDLAITSDSRLRYLVIRALQGRNAYSPLLLPGPLAGYRQID